MISVAKSHYQPEEPNHARKCGERHGARGGRGPRPSAEAGGGGFSLTSRAPCKHESFSGCRSRLGGVACPVAIEAMREETNLSEPSRQRVTRWLGEDSRP